LEQRALELEREAFYQAKYRESPEATEFLRRWHEDDDKERRWELMVELSTAQEGRGG
jgi:hypothetical protein